jgi:hypothetical protein
MKKLTILDIFICIISVIFLIFVLITQVLSIKNASTLLVQTPENKFYFSMNQKKTISVKGELGSSIIEIDNGRFRFKDSPCKNKICIQSGWVSTSNFPIICLPNKVSAYIISQTEKDEFDGVTQ